ncbi:hypothetical protein [Azorhizobium caulinodans]|uniref:hypothetical protein n=1 Tax=Azorhizobium caulinodans TaxID=7 RepID=UPI002FBD7BE1
MPQADKSKETQEAEARKAAQRTPAAGPHAKPHLTDTEKTPGSGTLPDPKRPQEGDATSG